MLKTSLGMWALCVLVTYTLPMLMLVPLFLQGLVFGIVVGQHVPTARTGAKYAFVIASGLVYALLFLIMILFRLTLVAEAIWIFTVTGAAIEGLLAGWWLMGRIDVWRALGIPLLIGVLTGGIPMLAVLWRTQGDVGEMLLVPLWVGVIAFWQILMGWNIEKWLRENRV